MTNKAPSAYQLEQAFSALMSARDRLEQIGYLFDEETGELLDFDLIVGNAEKLLHATLRNALEMTNRAKMVMERADKIAARADRYKARAEALRGAAFAAMDALELPRVELPDLTASIAMAPQSLRIMDEKQIPKDHWRYAAPTLDKAAITKALKAGVAVPGAELSNGLPVLRISTK